MLDPRTLWLAWPEDRYERWPVLRQAERAVYPLLRSRAGALCAEGTQPDRRTCVGDLRKDEATITW